MAGHDFGGNIAACLTAVTRDRGATCIRAQALLAPLLDPNMTRIGQNPTYATPDALVANYRAYLPVFMHHAHPYVAPVESRHLAHLPAAFTANVEQDLLRI